MIFRCSLSLASLVGLRRCLPYSSEVYVDITMRAAKENEATTAEQHSRESIRIARVTRELLKKFASAHHQFLSP